jgi:hypothetical protein
MDLKLRHGNRSTISDHNSEEGRFPNLNLLREELVNCYLGSLWAFQGRIAGPGIAFRT